MRLHGRLRGSVEYRGTEAKSGKVPPLPPGEGYGEGGSRNVADLTPAAVT
jgi:hypothetical protein